jgi:hypothetical protein
MQEFFFEREKSNVDEITQLQINYNRVARILIVGLYNPTTQQKSYFWCHPAEPYMREIESEEGLFDTKQAAQALAKSKGWILLDNITQNTKKDSTHENS